MTASIYGFPDIGRAGLGNLLLPWARCEIFCRQQNIPMLAPQWTQPKIGPVLRGERDKRYYMGLFNNRGYVRGVKRWALVAMSRKIDEKAFDPAAVRDGKRTLVRFSGLE